MDNSHVIYLQVGTFAKNIKVLFDVEPAHGREGCELGPWERNGLDKERFRKEGNRFETGYVGVWNDEACDGVCGTKLECVEIGHTAVEKGAKQLVRHADTKMVPTFSGGNYQFEDMAINVVCRDGNVEL